MKLYQHTKNQLIPSVYSSDTVNFRAPSHDMPHPFLAMPTSKIFSHLWICINLYQHAKNQWISSFYSWDTFNFRVKISDWPYQLLTMPNQKIYNPILNFVNLHQHAKNEAVSLISSGEIIDLKTLESDWLRVFWPISWEQDFFPKHKICPETQQTIKFFTIE